jgi:hypothetical protein
LIDATSLLGPPDRIAERIRAFAAAGVTTLSVGIFAGDLPASLSILRTVAAAFETSGSGRLASKTTGA